MNKILLIFLSLLVLSCGKDKSPVAASKTYSVKFRVSGFLSRVDIDYSDGNTSRQTYNYAGTDLPWEYSFSASTGQIVSVSARIRTGYISGGQDVSFVSANIYLDGELWKVSPFTSGQGSTAASSGTLP